MVALFTLGTMTLLLFVALSINVGQAVVRRHQVQILADTGALAGAAVQARGLNQMTRVNAAALRLFNVLQMRSRVGGYHEWRTPIVDTLAALVASRRIPTQETYSDPKAPKGKPKSTTLNVPGAIKRVIDRAMGLIKIVGGRDDDKAFRAMEPWFHGFRAYNRAANIFWELRARQVARDVTIENMRTLVGRRAHVQCSGVLSGCMRPIIAPSLKGLWDSAKSIKKMFDSQRKGRKGAQMSFRDWAKTIFDPRGQRIFDLLEGAGAPRLIPQWENPDGDILLVRYWTDTTKMEKAAFMAAVGGAMLAIPPLWPAIPALTRMIRWALTIEAYVRMASAPKWHDMRVTLHRKVEEEPDKQLRNDTRLVFWVKLPTTKPAMTIFYPFADLPEMTAVAAAKPIGGNFGSYPRAKKLSGGAALGAVMEAFSKAFSAVDDLLPANEHLYSRTSYGTGRVQMRGRGPITLPRNDQIKQERALIAQVYLADELEKMGIDPKDPPNMFWYTAAHHPYYEPRLVPLLDAYMDDIDILEDEDKSVLKTLYGGKEDKPWWRPW